MSAIVVVTLMLATAATACAAAPPPFPPLVVPDCLGVNIHFAGRDDAQMDMLAAAGFGFVRKDFVWGSIEAKKGEYDFAGYDQQVEALRARGIRALFILDYGNGNYEDGRPPCTDEGRAAFAAYAAAGAAHFRGKGVIWELWNEPNNHFGSPPSPEDYTKLARVTYQAMKKADPSCVFAAPALAGWDFAFLEKCCQAGLLQCTDAISLHPYGAPKPEDIAEYYATIRSIVADYAPKGRAYPLISSEWGYPAFDKGVTIEQHAQYLVRSFMMNLMSECRVSIWYCWRDTTRLPDHALPEMEYHFGAVYEDLKEKPTYSAMRTLAAELKGYALVRRLQTESDDDYLLLFGRNGDYRLAAWTARDPHGISIQLDAPSASLVSLLGEKRKAVVKGGVLELDLDGSVQYIEPSTPSRRWALEAAWRIGGGIGIERGRTVVRVRSDLGKASAAGTLAVTGDGMESTAVALRPGAAEVSGRYAWDGSSAPQLQARLVVDGLRQPIVRSISLDTSSLPSVEVLPATSTELLVAVNRSKGRARGAFRGGLVLDRASGVELANESVRFELAPEQERTVVGVKLARQPESILSFSCALLDARGNTILKTPAKRHFIVETFANGKPGEPVKSYGATYDASEDAPGGAAFVYAQAPTGSPFGSCARLDYSLGAGWKPAIVTPASPLPIPGKPKRLKAWVRGDGGSGSAKLRIRDASGETFQPNYGFMNFTGWRCIEVDLSGSRSNHWGGDNDGRLRYPISWDSIYAIESIGQRNTLKGAIHIGPLMLCYD